MNTGDYIAEINRQLADHTVYKSVNFDPKFDIARRIKLLVDDAYASDLIDVKLHDFLIKQHPVTPVSYTFRKIHKNLLKPPGHPIVSGIDSILAPLAIFLDRVLKPLAASTPSFIQDTTDFILKLESLSLSTGDLLVSFDVCSLYTSIAHIKGIEATTNYLRGTSLNSDQQEFVLSLLDVVLTCNYFMFLDRLYIQKRGTAMGANMAPSY
ncbi:hypothetical protein PRIEUP_LOCUS8431, partial [Pristimantis euphronides]